MKGCDSTSSNRPWPRGFHLIWSAERNRAFIVLSITRSCALPRENEPRHTERVRPGVHNTSYAQCIKPAGSAVRVRQRTYGHIHRCARSAGSGLHALGRSYIFSRRVPGLVHEDDDDRDASRSRRDHPGRLISLWRMTPAETLTLELIIFYAVRICL